MADATYQPKVYKKSGGDTLVVASGGTLAVESGGVVSYEAGAYPTVPYQTLGTSQTATAVTNFGLTALTGTTTGPTYSLTVPAAAGMVKYLALTATSSGVTHRAVINSASTGVSIDTTGGNQITLATSALRGVTLVSASVTAWRVVGTYSGASIAGQKTT